MTNELYKMIFKRKSFHLFRNTGDGNITESELADIKNVFENAERLYPDIKTELRIVPAKDIGFRRDAEYCLLIYSEKKDNYLMNAGYIGEQLDLYLVSRNIGTLWYGIGKPDKKQSDGLEYVIMLAVRKVTNASMFRKDMFAAKRKPLSETWQGGTLGAAEIARFAPSACNSQPWFVKNENGSLTVFRHKPNRRIGIMSIVNAEYFNPIDMGIYLCILEICLAENGVKTQRTLFTDTADAEYIKLAEYRLV